MLDFGSKTTSSNVRLGMTMAYQSKRFYLFNCDKTYDLEIVEKFLLEAGEKYDFKISVDRAYFGLQRMADLCEKTLPKLAMDFAVFVIHADESRLSINEDNAGIGYARLYRALLQKTDKKVLIVIVGDTYYRDEDEKAQYVISRWARRKIASQFLEEYLDGRQSFIFSWNEKHRLIHEEALRHFLDPGKRGFKFGYTPPKPLPKPIPPADPPAPIHPRQEDNSESAASRYTSFSHRSPRKRNFGDDFEDGRNEARSLVTGRAPTIYPAETVLLETYIRYGRISYENEDVTQRKGGWRPTQRQASDLMEDWKSTPVAKVTFISTGNGGVHYLVGNVTPTDLKEGWLWKCMVTCLFYPVHYLGILWWWCWGTFGAVVLPRCQPYCQWIWEYLVLDRRNEDHYLVGNVTPTDLKEGWLHCLGILRRWFWGTFRAVVLLRCQPYCQWIWEYLVLCYLRLVHRVGFLKDDAVTRLENASNRQ